MTLEGGNRMVNGYSVSLYWVISRGDRMRKGVRTPEASIEHITMMFRIPSCHPFNDHQ
jgi:hypothetical protein